MELFIIGDIHGCYHTLQVLLQHWNPETQHLISVGDLIDRGNHSDKVIRWAMETDAKYEHATFVRGNHEQLAISHFKSGHDRIWLSNGGAEALQQFKAAGLKKKTMLDWFSKMPLKWENDFVIVTHAGISDTPDPYLIMNRQGVLWNRAQPISIRGKYQVFGHTPQKSGKVAGGPHMGWFNIDTACVYGKCLTALVLDQEGGPVDVHAVPVADGDTNWKI